MGAPAVKPLLTDAIINGGSGFYTLASLGEATGLKATQISNAMRRIIIDQDLPGLRAVSRGRSWEYDPTNLDLTEQGSTEAPQTAEWYQAVGATASGKVLVRADGDQTGALYVLTPLDI